MESTAATEMATAHYSEGTVCFSGATVELIGLPRWHPLIVPNPMEQIFFATTCLQLQVPWLG